MDDRIIQVLDFIEENLDSSLSLDQLASIACLSSSQFHRLFKRQTGRTPFKFVEEIRMNKAYQMILRNRHLVKELSEQFGYRDYETFSRAFKKYFMLSPDDMSAMLGSIKSHMSDDEEHEILILTINDPEQENELIAQMKNFLKEKKIDTNELKEARMFKITPKDYPNAEKSQLIKNKYSLSWDEKLWKSLLKEFDDQDSSQNKL